MKIVFKQNPLGFHKRAMPAALASMAAHKQGRFWEMHDQMFANMRKLEDNHLDGYAEAIGLDMAQFKRDMADRGLKTQILNDQAAAVALGKGGTPAFFINGKALSGAQPFPAFKKEIDAEIAAADALIAKGTPLAGVHRARANANLRGKGKLYWDSMVLGKKARKPAPPVDPTVWKAEVFGHEPVKGKSDALVTIIEFSEFQ